MTKRESSRPYRCDLCNQPCDNRIKYTTVSTRDIYMGRIDKKNGKFTYFCSIKCLSASYIKSTLPVCKEILIDCPRILYEFERGLRASLHNKPEEVKTWLLCLTMMRDIERFYQAIVDGKSEYELHELRLKALHTDGLVLEEVHTYEDSMNYILRQRTQMEKLNIVLLGNRSMFMI